MIHNNYIQTQEMTTTDHFDLHNVLNKMVLMDKISQEEMDNLLIKSGLTKLGFGHKHEYQERLSQELSVINQLGFAGYFLTVGEVVDLIGLVSTSGEFVS